MNRHTFAKELSELFFFVKKQSLSQIPSISGVVGIFVGSWVASTFTTSPFRGFLASWGLVKGGTHVVSPTTYKFLIVCLPIVTTAVTAYLVHKLLKTYREWQLKRDMGWVAQLEIEIQTAVQVKMTILRQARDARLISQREFDTKQSNLYQSYTRANSARIKQLLLDKLGG
ncbi:MAG: hypothetical protein HY272_09790 [Gammaproteobacteria bacterium]|nr:hypothetical protein [Gammaproteobacteria bacterium]